MAWSSWFKVDLLIFFNYKFLNGAFAFRTLAGTINISSSYARVSMGLTDRRKTAKNLADSRKNWKILTVSRKQGKKELTVMESVP